MANVKKLTIGTTDFLSLLYILEIRFRNVFKCCIFQVLIVYLEIILIWIVKLQKLSACTLSIFCIRSLNFSFLKNLHFAKYFPDFFLPNKYLLTKNWVICWLSDSSSSISVNASHPFEFNFCHIWASNRCGPNTSHTAGWTFPLHAISWSSWYNNCNYSYDTKSWAYYNTVITNGCSYW